MTTKAHSRPDDVDASVREALAFVARHGVVLVSARGPVPRLIDVIAGEAIVGNWWSHAQARAIYAVLARVCDSAELLVCRLVERRQTLLHRRLWPALVRVADRLPADRVSRVCEEHTSTGKHVTREVSFPDWVPADVLDEGRALSEADALALLGSWFNTEPRAKIRGPSASS